MNRVLTRRVTRKVAAVHEVIVVTDAIASTV
jgi:hypothetical protein